MCAYKKGHARSVALCCEPVFYFFVLFVIVRIRKEEFARRRRMLALNEHLSLVHIYLSDIVETFPNIVFAQCTVVMRISASF